MIFLCYRTQPPSPLKGTQWGGGEPERAWAHPIREKLTTFLKSPPLNTRKSIYHIIFKGLILPPPPGKPYGGSRGWRVGGVRCPFKHSSLLGHYSQNYSIPSGSPLPLPFTISTPDSLLTLPPIYSPRPHVPLYGPVPVLLPLDSPPPFFTPNFSTLNQCLDMHNMANTGV